VAGALCELLCHQSLHELDRALGSGERRDRDVGEQGQVRRQLRPLLLRDQALDDLEDRAGDRLRAQARQRARLGAIAVALLEGVTAVKFGSINATSYIVNSDKAITAVSPPGSAKTTVDVTVTTAASGTSAISHKDRFVYRH
jgi:hypothetical protein